MSKKHITIDYCVFSSDKHEQMNYLAEIYNLSYSDLLRKLVTDKYMEETQRRRDSWRNPYRRAATVK